MRPKPNSTPDDLAFGINPCAMAIGEDLVRSLSYYGDTRNSRVLELVSAAEAKGIETTAVDIARLDELTADGVHQGILVRLRPLPLRSLDDVPDTGPSLAILLDHITDPQNLGAVVRTSVAVGVDAIVLPARRGVLLTPGVHRASAGLSFLAPMVAPQNLAQAVAALKQRGFWIVAAEAGEDSQPATSFDWPQRTALILGSEGEGIGQLLLRESDFKVALPMDPRVDSLNVGVACGALAYLWRRQWPLP